MAIDFTVRDIVHRITVKFFPSFLPEAKKKYHLKAVFQPEPDIAGKGDISTSPKIFEEGLNVGPA